MRIHYLRDGDLEGSEPAPGRFVLTWKPRRTDHPDYPSVTLNSERDTFPTDGGIEGVLEWAEGHFSQRDSRDLIDVSLDAGASDAEVADVSRILDDAGTPAVVAANYSRRSIGELPWVMLIAGVVLRRFLDKLADAAEDEAWKALKRLVRRIFDARRRRDRPDGAIRIDAEDGITVILTDDLPDDAYMALEQLTKAGYYIWDHARGEWQSPI